MIARRQGIVKDFVKLIYTVLYSKWITNKNVCIAHGSILSVLCQPGWEEGLGENGYMYMQG